MDSNIDLSPNSAPQQLIVEKNSHLALRLLKEICIIGLLYTGYTLIRNATHASKSVAYSHARSVLHVEKLLRINIEHSIHTYFLSDKWLIVSANYYYGSLHFIVTLFALYYVFRHDPKRYPRARNTVVIATVIALIGFVSYPLMPPRLLPHHYGFIDTLMKYPAFWSFDSRGFAAISNQFAAMPSVHIIWSTWCVFALLPYIKKKYLKIAMCCYPLLTFFVIIVTANHYVLDAIGGLTVFTFAYLVSRMITSMTTRSAIDKTASLAEIKAK